MIENKYINKIAALIIAIALVCTIFLVGYTNSAQISKTSPLYEKIIFGQDIISLDIVANEEDWKNMLENATDETYISCSVVVNGTKFDEVGIRPKGNSSLSQIARDPNSDRYSFKLKFDEFVKGQTCFGLDEFVVNNIMGDSTYMKEYISYDILKFIGAVTPLLQYSNITVNGEPWGLYLAIESYDDSFLAREFNDITGKLYNVKTMDMGNMNNMDNRPDQNNNSQFPNNDVFQPKNEQIEGNTKTQNFNNAMPPNGNGQMPNFNGGAPLDNGQNQRPQGGFGGFGGRGSGGGDLAYKDDNASSYSAIFDNAVSKITSSDSDRVITALKALSEGVDLEKYFNVDEILRYFAAHTVVVNLDSYVSNMAQNYYIYEKDGKIAILPWDYNLAFGGFQSGTAKDVINFPIDTPVSGVEMESRPLLDKLLQNEEYKEKYHSYLQEIVTSYFNNGLFESTVDSIDLKIKDYVKNDATAFYTYDDYEKSLPQFKKLCLLRSESIKGQLDGTIPSTTSSQKQNEASLIPADGVNLSALGSMMGGMGGNGQMGGIGGNRPQNFGQNIQDMQIIQKAMEIIQNAGGQITDEVKEKLIEIGITEDQIQMFMNMRNGMNGFGAPGGNVNLNGQQGNVNTSNLGSSYIVLIAATVLLGGGILFTSLWKRNF